MITLISATNRPDSNTLKIAHYYLKKLSKKGIEHAFFSLEQMPQDLLTNEMYGPNKNPKMKLIEETLLIPTTKFIFIVPEYNGSFPGAFKTFMLQILLHVFTIKKLAWWALQPEELEI